MQTTLHRGLVGSSIRYERVSPPARVVGRGLSHISVSSTPHRDTSGIKSSTSAWVRGSSSHGLAAARPKTARPWLAGRLAAASTSNTTTANSDLAIMQWTGDEEQVQALNRLRDAMASTEFGDEVTEEQLRWFLLDRKMQVDAAAEKLVKMLAWRKEFGADSITTTDVAQEAATGKAYLHTHYDVQRRPVIVVRAAKHVKDAAPLLHSQQLCVYTLERALEKLPEGQDTVLGIFDLRGFQSRNADMGFVKFMVDIFFTYYPKRLSQVLFVDAPWIFKPGWEMMKPWLKKYAALVRFVSADEVRRDYFTPETLPDDFKPPGFPRTRSSSSK